MKRHPNDQQPKHDDYVEVGETEAPTADRGGEFFLARYRKLCPDAAIVEARVPQAIRVNRTKTTDEELVRSLSRRAAFLKRIPFLDRGYAAQASFSFGATPEYLLGHYYLQAPLSQLVCEIMAPPPGATVLDMAAAPGGKTTYLAEMVGEGGVVVALDNDATRLAAVRNNAERLGIANILCVKKDARFAFDLGKKFDFVLLDAPCSGNFCSEEQWFGRRTMTDIKLNARVQMELLKAAYQCLAPGGVLVYSTCSLEPEEDECVIDAFLKRYPDMTVEPLDGLRDGARDIDGEDASAPLGDSGTTSWDGKPLDPRVAGTRRFWPHKTGFEGFYIARLRKAKKDA